MQRVTIIVENDYDYEFGVEDDATKEEIEAAARDALVGYQINYYNIVSIKTDKGETVQV